jgi:hypothetical protein
MYAIIQFYLGQGDPFAAGSGPSDAPSSAWADKYGGGDGKLRMTWVNGDATAYTRIYDAEPTGQAPDYVANPGEVSYDTNYSWADSDTYYLTHYKNGQESASTTYTHVGGRPT